MKAHYTQSRRERMQEAAREVDLTPGEAARLAANGVNLDTVTLSRTPHGLLCVNNKIMRTTYVAPSVPDSALTIFVNSVDWSGGLRRVYRVYAYDILVGQVSINNISGWNVEPITGGQRRAQEYGLGLADKRLDAVKQLLYVVSRNA